MNENQKLGTIMKELIRFSLPLILSGVLQQLYTVSYTHLTLPTT